MKKAKCTAVFLAVIMIFVLFIGTVYAGNDASTYIDSTTLVIEDGKVISGDKSLVENGIVVIGDAESSSQANGKQPVKDNSDLITPEGSTGGTQSGVSLPVEKPTYVNSNPSSIATANRSVGEYLNFDTGTWNPATYDLMIMHHARLVTGTIHVNIAHMARAIAGGDVSTPTSDTNFHRAFVGEFFRIKDGGNITIENNYSNRGGVTVLDGLRVYYNTYDLNSDGTNSPTSKFLNDYLIYWGNWSYLNWEAASPEWFDPIIIQDGGTSTFNETTFQNGLADENGAALQLNGGTFNMNGGAFRHCRAKTNGGALYVGSGTANLNGVTFDNCTAGSNGGAIYVTGGTVNLTNVTITNCSANKGGAIYVTGSATIKLTNTTVSQNKATSTGGSGGALWIGSNSTVNIEGTSKINNNLAYNHGGAIRVNSNGKLNVSGSTEIKNSELMGNIVPASENIASRGTYKGNNSTYNTTYGDGSWNEYHVGKLVDGNDALYSNSCVMLTGSNNFYIYFKFTGEVHVDSIKLYMFHGNGVNSAVYSAVYYPNKITAYINNSESLTGATLLGECAGDSSTEKTLGSEGSNKYFLKRKEYKLNSAPDNKGTYVILEIQKSYYYLFCSEIQINGYFSSQVTSETTYGGGIYNEGTTTISGGALEANKATLGGGVYVAGGTFGMTGGTIKNHTASTHGGGIYVAGGTATFSGSEISGNSVTVDGGGICCYGGTAEVKGGTIKDNSAPQGGGLYVKGPGTIKMSGGKITSNDNGSGVFLYDGAKFELSGSAEISSNTVGSHPGGGVAIYNNINGTFTMTGGTISGHTAGGHHGIAQTTGGGTLEIKGGTIKDNGSTGVSGGGIYATVGSVKISGGTIGENGAPNTGNDGGGIFVDGSTSLEISGSAKIQYNTATVSGGGVFANGTSATFTMSGGFVSNNVNTGGNGGGLWIGELKSFSMTGGTVEGNKSEKSNGGGLFFNRTIITNNGITGGTITKNEAKTNGGGIYVGNYGGNLSLSVQNAIISQNSASNGGGIAAFEEDAYPDRHVQLTVNNCTIIKNTSSGNGGGIYAYKSKISISSSTIGRITADNTNEGNTANSLGGGVCFLFAESSTISNSIINGNSTSTNAGGGICIDTTVVTMSGNNEVNSNVAAMYGGGIVVRSDAATATLNINTDSADTGSTSINANSILQYSGGGIHVGPNGALNMKGGYINNNSATHQNGGGLDMQGVVSLNGTTVSNNDSVLDGGGICVRGSNAKLTMVGGTVSENETSSGNGGGLCIKDTSLKSTVTGTVFTGNTALFETPDMTSADSNGKLNRVYLGSTGNGGAIYVTGLNNEVEISNAHIGHVVEGGYSNKAINGGAVAALYGAKVTVSNSEVIYNSALRCGGAYFVLGFGTSNSEPNATTTLNVIGGKVENNYARAYTAYDHDNEEGSAYDDALSNLQSEMGGGGFFFRGTNFDQKKVTIGIDGTAINNNSSTRGGAIYHHESVNATIKNASFDNNSADLLGGAFCFIKNSSTAKFTDCTFTKNNATLRGGALYIQTNGVTVERCTFTENTAANNGGAIQLQSETNTNINLKVTDSDFVGNSANYGGALCTAQTNNRYAFTVTLTNCDFTGNRATANGGAVLVGNKVTLNMTGGYLTGNIAGTDESGIEPVADNNQGSAITGISGAGGAVAVFDGTFSYTVNATNKGAIHSNTASTAGDDIFSNGSANSKLNIPAVSAMDLTGYTYEVDRTPDWFEDYAKGEASGMNPNISNSERYRFSDNTILAHLDNVNTQGKYVAITVGVSVNLGELIITKSGDDVDPNQVFVFEISGVSQRSGNPILITVSIKGTGSLKIVDLPAGDYTVRELTSWSWRYGVTTIEVDGEAVQFTNAGVDIKVEPDYIDHSVEFINSLQNSKWLSHNATPIKNIPNQNTVAYSDMVFDLPKKKTI